MHNKTQNVAKPLASAKPASGTVNLSLESAEITNIVVNRGNLSLDLGDFQGEIKIFGNLFWANLLGEILGFFKPTLGFLGEPSHFLVMILKNRSVF